jgi:hypothetical protein
MIRITIPGPVPSLKNQKKIGRGRMYDDPEVVAYKRDFGFFVPPEYKTLKLGSKRRFVRVDVRIFAQDWRRDADAEILYDCLQVAGVLSNDRWARLKTISAVSIDPARPRAEIDVIELAVGTEG